MLETIQNTQVHNGTDNILLSLEYLREEAKREDNFRLYEILDTACILGREVDTVNIDEDRDMSLDKDMVRAAILIIKFLKASTEAKEIFIEILKDEDVLA